MLSVRYENNIYMYINRILICPFKAVAPKECSVDRNVSTTSSQGICGYISVIAALKFTNFLIKD